ncbi:AmmeMemoRadiSam system radical SAM enzyme [Pleionea sediminis]|uniref:AmmeMemoRadiSam system radical SAM enzyme n=1 Tax=Pleionea sediminis TaxID=2569479 RepID=UPI001185F417|nr:AmmeMemoRadiSam system radical SAM enzyme [Pleionea sediminis]
MTTVSTQYWHAIDSGKHRGKIQCDLCPRFCQLSEGQRGLCYVRGREDDQVKLFSYGRSSGFCIDPIEKKPLNHFYPGSSVLSFGTAGCNLACKFCQNWDMSKSREMDTLASAASPEQIARAAKNFDCNSVAYTYNDPVIFLEYARDTAIACKEQNINSVAVTAGYITEPARKEFFQYMDAVNVDLKAFTDEFYLKLCGAHLNNVLDTLNYIYHETQCWLEITTLLIPEKNDSNKEINELSEWIMKNLGPDVPLHFSAFHPDWKMKDIPATPAETLTRARDIAIKNGLNYVYTGNVHDTLGSSTYCPSCNKKLIERDWYELGEWHLEKGSCQYCGTAIAGHFKNESGTFGARRIPLFNYFNKH